MIKYFDIFAGIGGFRSGLEKAGGFECVGYCEIDRYAQKAYETMYDTEGEVYYDDARKIDPNELPDFDLICCCPPRKTQKTQQSVSKREKYTKPLKTLQLQRFRSAIN